MSCPKMIIFLSFLVFVLAQPPNCTRTCDNPVCHAICTPKCLPTNCTVSGCPSSQCDTPTCFTQCEPVGNQSITETCPMCETICLPLRCSPASSSCVVLCEAPTCGWSCRKPTLEECPQLCEINCEMPACEFSGSSFIHPSLGIIALLSILFLV